MEIEVKVELPDGFNEEMEEFHRTIEARFNARMQELIDRETDMAIKELMYGTGKIKNPTGIINQDNGGVAWS